jgi:hypothetical protein
MAGRLVLRTTGDRRVFGKHVELTVHQNPSVDEQHEPVFRGPPSSGGEATLLVHAAGRCDNDPSTCECGDRAGIGAGRGGAVPSRHD